VVLGSGFRRNDGRESTSDPDIGIPHARRSRAGHFRFTRLIGAFKFRFPPSPVPVPWGTDIGGRYGARPFGDVTPLGLVDSDECRIGSILQSWSVLSGAGGPVRSLLAVAAAGRKPVRPDPSLIKIVGLLFDHSERGVVLP
jgi:hypothetical protein